MLFRARSGNHYDSMIKEGIPRAIEWMKEQLAAHKYPEPSISVEALPIGAPIASAE